MISEDVQPLSTEQVNADLEAFEDVPYDAIRKIDRLLAKSVSLQQIDNGNSGSAITINWMSSNKQKLTLSADCTITFTAPSGPCNLIFVAVNFGAHTPTFSPAIKWPSGTAPAFTASGTDIIGIYYDGSAYYGVTSTNFS